jgi:hypothetical protein
VCSSDLPEYYLKSFKRTVTQLEAFLSEKEDLKGLLEIVPHNPESFYWNGAADVLQEYFP